MKLSISVTTLILIALFSSANQASPLLLADYIQFAQNNNQDLDHAVKSIQQKTKGRILSAIIVKTNGQKIYKIKVLLPSGKIQTFKVTAQ